MPARLFFELFGKNHLIKDDSSVKGYGGDSLVVLGAFIPIIKFNNLCKPFKFLVIENANVPIVGRNFFYEFEVKTITVNGVHDASNDDLKMLITEYDDLFGNEIGRLKDVKIRLEVNDDVKAKFVPARKVPYAFRDTIGKQLADLERQGIIAKTDSSDWGTPLVPVMKKDGSIRICADYRVTVNKFLKDTNYPLPRIADIFSRLHGSKIFTTIDLARAYNQIELDEESQKMVAWSTHLGNFIMKRLPFGIKPATGIFQREIERVLKDIPGVINFLDDIIIAAQDMKTHNERLRIVFERLRKFNLKLNLSKCSFAKSEITFLGHVLSESGLKKQIKYEAVLNAPEPKNVNELRAFCGMVNYYGKFMENLATKMHPLYMLLRKDQPFDWSQGCQLAFDAIKKEIVSDTVLTHFNTDLPIILTCDASSVGIGAVLSHIMPDGSERPVEFASRVLSNAEKNYGVIQKEALSIIYGTNKFYQYLIGKPFVLRTDHKPLLAIFGDKKGIPQMSASRLQRWALHLSAFRFKIEHVSSADNVADMLSRLPVENVPSEFYEEPEASYLCYVRDNADIPVDYQELLESTANDPELQNVIEYVQNGKFGKLQKEFREFYEKRFELSVEEGILLWGHRIVVPNKLRSKVLRQVHSSHMGMVKTKSILRSYVWWPGIDKAVETMLKSCESCMLHSTSPPKVPCIPWPNPTRPWSRIHIDYAGPINDVYILIVLDAKSKWIEACITRHATAEFTINKLEELFARFGLPDVIVSDNGTQFTAAIFAQFLLSNGIDHKLTAPGYPATNGAAENAVKTIKYALYRILHECKQLSVEKALARFLADYRTTPHSTTKLSPAECLLGYKPKIKMDLMKFSQVLPSEEERESNKAVSRERGFIEEDMVIVRDYTNCNHPSWKKAKVERVLGPRNYLCRLLNGRLIKRHVNQMRMMENCDSTESTLEFKDSSQPHEEGDREELFIRIQVPDNPIIDTLPIVVVNEFDVGNEDILIADSDSTSDNDYESCMDSEEEETLVNDSGLPMLRNEIDLGQRTRNQPSRFKDYVLY